MQINKLPFEFLIIILLFTSLIFISGCTSQQDSKELYKELTEKGKTLPDGKFDYAIILYIDLGESSSEEIIPSFKKITIDTEIYSFNKNIKISRKMDLMGTTVEYINFQKNNLDVSCVKNPQFMIMPENMNCKRDKKGELDLLVKDTFTNPLNENIDKLVNITLLGEKQYSGRNCYDFLIILDGTKLKEFMKLNETDLSPSISKDTNIVFNICLDKQYGFTSFFEVNFSEYDSTLNKEITDFSFNMKLNNYDPQGANEEDVKIPYDFAIEELKCKTNTITVILTPFNEMEDELSVAIGKYIPEQETVYNSEYTINTEGMQIGDEKIFTINLDEELTIGSNEIAICPKQGKCIKDVCYYFG